MFFQIMAEISREGVLFILLTSLMLVNELVKAGFSWPFFLPWSEPNLYDFPISVRGYLLDSSTAMNIQINNIHVFLLILRLDC